MGRAINMENQIDTLIAKMEILEKRVKLIELQVKTLENNEKATKVIPLEKLELNEEDAKETIENSKKAGKKNAKSN